MEKEPTVNIRKKRIDYRIDYFWSKFKYSGLNNFESLSDVKKYQKIDKKIYLKIVKRFFLVYFNEVFYLNRPMYFVFGGEVIRVRVGNFILSRNYVKTYINSCISFLWYNRPMQSFFDNCRINLMNGKDELCPMAALRRQWTRENDVGELPAMKQKLKEAITDHKMFRL